MYVDNGYGNTASVEYFAQSFINLLTDQSILQTINILEWMNKEILKYGKKRMAKKHNCIKSIVLSILIIFITLNLISCNRSNNDLLFSSDKNCNPPCWENIIPGKTTKSEVVELLKENPKIDTNSIVTKGEQWNGFNDVVFFKFRQNIISGEIYFINDKATLIVFFGDLGINFGDAVKFLGEPSYILNVPVLFGPPGFPQTSYEIQALIPNKGVNFAYNTNDINRNNKSIIAPENKITRMDFYDVSAYDQLLEAGMFSEGNLNKEESIKYIIPWSGYGDINQKYPPAVIP